MKSLKSQKGYSLVEVGIGIVIISIFMVYSITMIRGTFNTYRYIEQKNIAMSYILKAVEKELLDDSTGLDLNITDGVSTTKIIEQTPTKTITSTTIPNNNMVIYTTVEALADKNGVSYADSKVKLLTVTAEFYLKKSDASSKRELEIKTLKIGRD